MNFMIFRIIIENYSNISYDKYDNLQHFTIVIQKKKKILNFILFLLLDYLFDDIFVFQKKKIFYIKKIKFFSLNSILIKNLL